MHAAACCHQRENSSLIYREWIIGILDSVAVSAAKLGADEIGIVTDFYNALSIKGFTRNTRGKKSPVKFAIDDRLPDDFTNGEFKTQLNEAFSDFLG